MPNSNPSNSPHERLLADRLKGEIDAARPAFSDELHARIMRRVAAVSEGRALHNSAGNAGFARPEKRDTILRRPVTRAWATLTAALVVSVGGLWFGLASRSPIGEQGLISSRTWTKSDADSASGHLVRSESTAPAANAEVIGDTVMLDQAEILDQTAHLVESVLTTQQWAYLEHDAQVFANLLFDQLPLEARPAGDL